jgi:RecA/RadA recombinase
MKTPLLADIKHARSFLSSLNEIERRSLVLRIVGELIRHREGLLGLSPAAACVSIDRLIASMSIAISEIASMKDDHLRLLLEECENLLATLQGFANQRGVATLH